MTRAAEGIGTLVSAFVTSILIVVTSFPFFEASVVSWISGVPSEVIEVDSSVSVSASVSILSFLTMSSSGAAIASLFIC